MDNSFLEEVEEEIRRDRLYAFWTKYKKIIIITFSLVILGIVGYLQFLSVQHDKAETSAKQIIKIFFEHATGHDVDARLEELAKNSNENLSELSKVMAAAIKLKSNISDEVDVGYERLEKLAANCKDIVAKDLAVIVLASYDLDHTKNYKELMSTVELLTFTRRPFRLMAMELLGTIAIQMGDKDRAKACFGAIIKDPEVTESMRTRAELIMSSI